MVAGWEANPSVRLIHPYAREEHPLAPKMRLKCLSALRAKPKGDISNCNCPSLDARTTHAPMSAASVGALTVCILKALVAEFAIAAKFGSGRRDRDSIGERFPRLQIPIQLRHWHGIEICGAERERSQDDGTVSSDLGWRQPATPCAVRTRSSPRTLALAPAQGANLS